MKDIPEIPGYRIEKELGQGGMARVFLGVQENLKREVAIKILIPEMVQDKQYLQRFLNEAHTASKLSHPNIVTIHDVGQVGQYCYIVMERLHSSLVERVKFNPRSRLKPIEALKIVKQIAGALDYAHGEGVIHRDIKPDNILFRKDGNPVLVDFGIARVLHSNSNLTSAEVIIGTPQYMSPEQCRGEDIDGQSDFYSLGVVLFEILSGKVPYKANSTAGVIFKQVQEPVPQLSTELSKYQPLLNKMMAKEKWERVANGAELARLIEDFRPDGRVETIKGVKEEAWVFDHRRKNRPGKDNLSTEQIVTLQSPRPESLSPHQHKSKGPLIVFILSIPFILGAIYLVFFHDWSDRIVNNVKADQTAQSANPGATDQTMNPENKEYNGYFSLAQDYYKKELYDKSLEMLIKAKSIQESLETKELEKKINQKIEEVKQREYLKHIGLAKEFLKGSNFKGARENLVLAKKYKDTKELKDLLENIKTEEREKTEKEARDKRALAQKRRRQRQDDLAFNQARSRNTIYAYEKYQKKYPKGRHFKDAQQRIDQLKKAIILEDRIQDDIEFESAIKKNTISAYYEYLKKRPFGLHVTEAKQKLDQLKRKIVKETKITLDIQTIRFFESGLKAPAVNQRNHANRFPKQSTRYIYTEIVYRNKLYRIAESRTSIKLLYTNMTNTFKQELTGTILQDKGAQKGLYWRGVGWTDPGRWELGIYTVTLFLDGKELGKSIFEVF
jgi:serine/threonine protein kinase